MTAHGFDFDPALLDTDNRVSSWRCGLEPQPDGFSALRFVVVTIGGRKLTMTPGECRDYLGETYECMNCGTVRTSNRAQWESCDDELGKSCKRRAHSHA